MNKDKFLTGREKKIKSVKEKADALYNNLSKTDLSYRDSEEYLNKKMFKLLIKYTNKPKQPYSEEVAKSLIEGFARKEFGDKIYDEKYASISNKEKKKDLKNTAINIEEKKSEQPAPDIKISPLVNNKNYIPYNVGITREFIENNRHLGGPCDPNEIIEKKEKQSNGFVYAKFDGYY
jgi:hypothetical protein